MCVFHVTNAQEQGHLTSCGQAKGTILRDPEMNDADMSLHLWAFFDLTLGFHLLSQFLRELLDSNRNHILGILT